MQNNSEEKRKFKITIHFLKIEPSFIEGDNLMDLINLIITTDVINGSDPIYIETDAKKYLYDRNIYTDFIDHGDYREFLIKTEITGVFRNKRLLIVDGVEVDANSLWWSKGNKCILVDDDRLLETNYELELFTDKI